MRYLLITLAWFLIAFLNPVAGQDKSKALVSFQENRVFVGINNSFRVVIQQQEPVSLDQLSAFLMPYGEETEPEPIPLEISQNDYGFSLLTNNPGVVEITVTLQDGTKEQYNFRTRPLTARMKIGGYGAGTLEPVRTNVFKSQRGIHTQIKEVEVSGGCNVVSFELIRITSSEDARVIFNSGGSYELEAKRLIMAAQPGDRYIFTKIRYRCPGALVDQMGETLSFELE